MLVYLINLFLIGTYSFLYNLKFKGNKKAVIFFVFLITFQLIFLLTLKNVWVGADMPNYWEYYSEQLNWSLGSLQDSRFEIGFKILTKVVTSITVNQQVYLGIIATLSTMPVGYVIYKYSRMPFLSFVLYITLNFFAFTFSGLRQAVAIGFVLLAFTFMRQRKIIKYLIAMGFAISFHFSAILFLPVYLLRNFSLSSSKLIILAILGGLISVFKIQIMTEFVRIFYPSYSIVLTDSYSWMAICAGMTLLAILFYNKIIERDSSNRILYMLVIVGAMLMLFAPVADNVMRIANYFFIYIILLIPEVIQVMRYARTRAISSGLLVAGLLGVYIFLLQIDGYKTVPYYFNWQYSGTNQGEIQKEN